jgi:hypothetical protein
MRQFDFAEMISRLFQPFFRDVTEPFITDLTVFASLPSESFHSEVRTVNN